MTARDWEVCRLGVVGESTDALWMAVAEAPALCDLPELDACPVTGCPKGR